MVLVIYKVEPVMWPVSGQYYACVGNLSYMGNAAKAMGQFSYKARRMWCRIQNLS